MDALTWGALVIDPATGCTSIEGQRIIWPPGTRYDAAAGTATLTSGATHKNSDQVRLGGGLQHPDAVKFETRQSCPNANPSGEVWVVSPF